MLEGAEIVMVRLPVADAGPELLEELQATARSAAHAVTPRGDIGRRQAPAAGRKPGTPV
jgi:hypothetical protein